MHDNWKSTELNDPQAILRRAVELHHPRLTLACSFSMEDLALVHMLHEIDPTVRVFALDTGRLDPETYECAEAVRRRYNIEIEWYFPRHDAVEEIERAKGLFSFRDSIDNRKECCGIRKVEPLGRALAGVDAWITGLRREQSVTRSALDVVEIDDGHSGIFKINPLAAWTLADAEEFTTTNKVPYNSLYDRNYTSIGCAPCTRAITAGEDQRAGRWWWENPEHKECGLHR